MVSTRVSKEENAVASQNTSKSIFMFLLIMFYSFLSRFFEHLRYFIFSDLLAKQFWWNNILGESYRPTILDVVLYSCTTTCLGTIIAN